MKNTLNLLICCLLPLSLFAQIDMDDLRPEAPASANPRYESGAYTEYFQEGALKGIRDAKTKHLLIPAEYEELDWMGFSDFMVVKKNGKFGVINKKGAVIIPFEFQKILASASSLTKRYPGLLAKKDNLWGLLDQQGKILEPFEWAEAHYYTQSDSLVLLSKKGLQRLLNRQGKILIETNFDRWENQGRIDRRKYIYVRQNEKSGIIDFKKQSVLPFVFGHIMWMEGKLLAVTNDKGRYGLIDLNGRELLPMEHGVIAPLDKMDLVIVNSPDAKKQGVINSEGVFVLPIAYERVYMTASKALLRVKQPGGKWALFDRSGKQLTDFNFEQFLDHEGVSSLIFGQVGIQQFRLLNAHGAFVSPDTFNQVVASFTAFTASKNWAKHAFFRLDGKQLTDFIYGSALGFNSENERVYQQQINNLPKDRIWIGMGYNQKRAQIFMDNEGREYNPLKR